MPSKEEVEAFLSVEIARTGSTRTAYNNVMLRFVVMPVVEEIVIKPLLRELTESTFDIRDPAAAQEIAMQIITKFFEGDKK